MTDGPRPASPSAPGTDAAKAAVARPWRVLVFGPGVEPPAAGSARAVAWRADDAVVYEARSTLGAGPVEVLVRACGADPPGRAALALLADAADACVFVPATGGGPRNRRSLGLWTEALARPATRAAGDAPWFVVDDQDAAAATALRRSGERLRPLLRGADFVDAGRAAVAILAGERGSATAAGPVTARMLRRARRLRIARVAATLAAAALAFAAALAAAGL